MDLARFTARWDRLHEQHVSGQLTEALLDAAVAQIRREARPRAAGRKIGGAGRASDATLDAPHGEELTHPKARC